MIDVHPSTFEAYKLKLVWHYTTQYCARGIRKDGQINPATEKLYGDEKPVTWFSADQFFEQTATKLLKADLSKLATFDEMCAEKLWRFGISPAKLEHWPNLIKSANIPPDMVNFLEQEGSARGAKPTDWFGILRPVLLSEIEATEQFDGDNWIPSNG